MNSCDLDKIRHLIKPGEFWFELPRFPGYLISDQGQVVSLRSCRILKSASTATVAYSSLVLKNTEGKFKTVYIHTLLAEVLYGPRPSSHHDCCHNDGNRANNSYKNLRWDTKSANNLDKREHGTMMRGENHPFAVLSNKVVLEMKSLRKHGTSYKKIAKQFGVSTMTALMAIKGQTWRHIGEPDA